MTLQTRLCQRDQRHPRIPRLRRGLGVDGIVPPVMNVAMQKPNVQIFNPLVHGVNVSIFDVFTPSSGKPVNPVNRP